MTAGSPVMGMLQALKRPWARALRGWDRISIYLPVLLMGLLVLVTYWLVRNSPVPPTPEEARAARHEADYFMRKFTLKTYDEDGLMKSEVNGTEARHYPDTDTLEIDQPRMRSVSLDGRITTSTSKRALTNGDGSEVQLFGDAKVVREPAKDAQGNELPRMEFQGEFLHAYVNDERVKSHLPVVLTRGADRFTGDTFAYDNITGIADLKGRVTGLMMPRTPVQAR